MSRGQKEQLVLGLYHEGKTMRDIAELTHMSFRDIGAITNKYKEKIERENGQIQVKDDMKSKSKETQAMKLFSEGQTPPQVLIELDLPPENVRTIHRQYLETKSAFR